MHPFHLMQKYRVNYIHAMYMLILKNFRIAVYQKQNCFLRRERCPQRSVRKFTKRYVAERRGRRSLQK